MKVNLNRKCFAIFGLRGVGKSTLSDYIANSYGLKCLIYDTMNEVPETALYNSYTPTRPGYAPELEQLITTIKTNRQFECFIIDEANRYCPPKPSPLPRELADLNDQARHYNLSIGYIARRPCQLNQDLTELADYLFIFHLKGKADIQYLENLSDGLGKAVLELDHYEFMLVHPDRSFQKLSPIEPNKKWLDSAERHLSGTKSSV